MSRTGWRGIDFLLQTVAASAAMTASQRAEMLVTRRAGSDLPVRVVERLTGRSVSGEAARTVVGHLAQGGLAPALKTLARRCSGPATKIFRYRCSAAGTTGPGAPCEPAAW